MIKNVQETSISDWESLQKEIKSLEKEFDQEIKLLKNNSLKAPEDVVEYALKKIQASTKEGSSLSEC